MIKLNFIINRFSDIDFSEEIVKNGIFSLSVKQLKDIEKINLQDFHVNKIYSNKQFNFSLCFDLSSTETSNQEFFTEVLKKRNLFIQLIFHPNFKKNENQPLIFITLPPHSNKSIDQFISDFESIVIKQGYGKIKWIYFDNGPKNELINIIYQFNAESFFREFYFKFLIEKKISSNFLGIINNSNTSFKNILDSKKLIEEKFQTDFPDQYAFFKKHDEMENEIPFLKEMLAKTEEDLANQKIYLSVLKAEDEANKINNFYYNEYEILPSWYKKLGHLLKVITGKRAFRSLFDNNVKKYKD